MEMGAISKLVNILDPTDEAVVRALPPPPWAALLISLQPFVVLFCRQASWHLYYHELTNVSYALSSLSAERNQILTFFV